MTTFRKVTHVVYFQVASHVSYPEDAGLSVPQIFRDPYPHAYTV